MQKSVKVGLWGVGLNTYWGQFEELLPRLLDYQEKIKAGIEKMDVEVVNVGMVDSLQKANESAALKDSPPESELIMLFPPQFCP